MFDRISAGIALEADGTVRVAQLKATPRSLVLLRTATFEPGGGDAGPSWNAGFSRAVEEGFDLSDAVIGLPDSLVYRKSLTLPFRNRSRIMQVLNSELEGEIPLPPETFVADYIEGPQDGDALHITVLAAENRTVESILEMVGPETRLSGLQTKGVGVLSAALKAGIIDGVVVWCTDRDAVLIEIRGSRTAGIRRVHLAGVDDQDSPRVAETVRFMARPGDRIWVQGRGPVDSLCRLLESEGNYQVSRTLDMGISRAADGPRGPLDDHLPAIGLALRGIGARAALTFDLRQGRFATSAPMEGLRGPMVRTAVIAGLALLLGVGSLVVSLDRAREQYESYASMLETEFKELFPGTRVVNEIAQATEKLDSLEKRAETLTGLSGGSALAALSRLSVLVPDEVALKLDELSYDSRKLRLEGSVSSFDSVDKIKTSLEDDPMFSEVQVQNARVGADLNKVTFRLVMEVN